MARGASMFVDDVADVSSETEEDEEPIDSAVSVSVQRSSDSERHEPAWPGPSTTSNNGKRPRHRKAPPRDTGGVKLEWSDDEIELNVKQPPKKRVKKESTSKPVRRGPRPSARAKQEPMVGRIIKKQRQPSVKVKLPQDSSDDDGTKLEEAQPDYLKNRKTRFKVDRERLQEEGLRLPPDYEDIDFSDDEYLSTLSERPQFDKIKPCNPYEDKELPLSAGVIPAPVAQYLRPYQFEGAAFMHKKFVYQQGCILGDDMGLGKTIQVIAFLLAAFGKTGDERDGKRMRKMRRAPGNLWYPRVLIICPLSLMNNWESEFKTWGWFHVERYHDSQKQAVLEIVKSGYAEVVITTYGTYVRQQDLLNAIEWDCVIADEVHQIKNYMSETTLAMNDINAMCRIGLTGTAVQNNYEELWALLNWANPGQIGARREWIDKISTPLKLGQSYDATPRQLKKARDMAQKLAFSLLPHFFLRRTKKLISKELPTKTDRVVFCPLTDTQQEAYKSWLSSDTVQTIVNSTNLCECRSGKKQGWCCQGFIPGTEIPWLNEVFPSIMMCQRLSSHLALVIPQSGDTPDQQSRALDVLQTVRPDHWRELYETRDSILNYANQEFCGKWRVLKKLLKFWHEAGDKVLVFSHSVRLLKMFQELFNLTTSYNVSYLDGSMDPDDRAAVVTDFNTSPDQFVFLISTRAGGVGLNITSANKVVIVDPNWNPAHDMQAQDRAYRIGQKRSVEVFRLVSAGTIEELVYARQIYKQQQMRIAYDASKERRYFSGVQARPEQRGEIFGLKNMFTYRPAGSLMLHDIIHKTNIAESRAGVDVIGLDVDGAEQEISDDDNRDEAANDDPANDDAEHADAEILAVADLIKQGSDPSSYESAGPGLRMRNGGNNTSQQQSSAPRANPVSAILAQAGVTYSHNNAEVIGTSRVEGQLSRRAVHLDSGTSIFVNAPSEALPSAQRNYYPTADICARQLCTMARLAGLGNDVVRYAARVEASTTKQRAKVLSDFYDMLWKGEVEGFAAPEPPPFGGEQQRPYGQPQQRRAFAGAAPVESVPVKSENGVKDEDESYSDDDLDGDVKMEDDGNNRGGVFKHESPLSVRIKDEPGVDNSVVTILDDSDGDEL